MVNNRPARESSHRWIRIALCQVPTTKTMRPLVPHGLKGGRQPFPGTAPAAGQGGLRSPEARVAHGKLYHVMQPESPRLTLQREGVVMGDSVFTSGQGREDFPNLKQESGGDGMAWGPILK